MITAPARPNRVVPVQGSPTLRMEKRHTCVSCSSPGTEAGLYVGDSGGGTTPTCATDICAHSQRSESLESSEVKTSVYGSTQWSYRQR